MADESQLFFVYLLESIANPASRYVGFTAKSIEDRLAEHNSGKSVHTNKLKPWRCVARFGFADKDKAYQFERYLKHGSGHAFARKHFW